MTRSAAPMATDLGLHITSLGPNQTEGDIRELDPITLVFALRRPHVENEVADLLIPVYEVSYVLACQEEGAPFFSDRIDLFGQFGPGVLTTTPGISVPRGCQALEVHATLLYQTSDGRSAEVGSSVAQSVEPLGDTGGALSGLYQAYRDGYVKRHILASGRGLSGIWLREYEPGWDRKELLTYARVSAFSPHGRHLYVPWIRECRGGTCGSSMTDGADTLYGGHENPLLRGGLAMAALALEYLTHPHRVASLGHALKIFDYVEACEYVDPRGVRTGFFLRSRHPGNLHTGDSDSKEYFYASVDELSGMILGMVHLDQALELAGDRLNQERLEALATRLGEQLARSHYVLVPPKDSPLVKERQRGWYGAYLFEWYIRRALRGITGIQDGFNPATSLVADFEFLRYLYDVPAVQGGATAARGFDALVALGIPASERALLAIEMLGVAMYYSGRSYPICKKLFGNSRRLCQAAEKLTAAVCSVMGATCTETALTEIDLTSYAVPRFNFPLLLHLFLAGTAHDGQGPTQTVGKLKAAMATLIRGVLTQGASSEVLFGLLKEKVGTPDPENEYYAAAIAHARELVGSTAAKHASVLHAAIERTAAQAPTRFALQLPAGENRPFANYQPACDPKGEQCSCTAEGRCTLHPLYPHNPERRIGKFFVWERGPGRRVQNAGNDGDAGLATSVVADLYRQRRKDAFVEGAGVGLLLPAALLHHHSHVSTRGLDSLADSPSGPYLPACYTLPALMATIDTTHAPDPLAGRCDFAFPRTATYDPGDEDGLGLGRRNDSYAAAALLAIGEEKHFLLDKETHPIFGDVPYAIYTPQRRVGQPEHRVAPDADYDYFLVENVEQRALTVELTVAQAPQGSAKVLVVDDLEPALANPGSAPLQVSVRGRAVHTVMVTGGMGPYAIRISTPR